jgi:hypothetical protein
MALTVKEDVALEPANVGAFSVRRLECRAQMASRTRSSRRGRGAHGAGVSRMGSILDDSPTGAAVSRYTRKAPARDSSSSPYVPSRSKMIACISGGTPTLSASADRGGRPRTAAGRPR